MLRLTRFSHHTRTAHRTARRFITMSTSNNNIFTHPDLGQIEYLVPSTYPHLTRFLNLPYGEISERLARSTVRNSLGNGSEPYVATTAGPSSVQPHGSAKMDAQGLQLPTDEIEEGEGEWQSETESLQLSITLPRSELDELNKTGVKAKLPVLVFLHGGAFFLGSGDRSYYNPNTFMTQALQGLEDGNEATRPARPILFIAANYRLGAHGFMHSPSNSPPNNGLHDQLTLFRWIHKYVPGFGGDLDNITLMGQSAGAESVSLHNLVKDNEGWKPYRRSIMFSGSPLCMPAKTPDEHETNFRQLVGKMMGGDKGGGRDDDGTEGRSSKDLVEEIKRGGKEREDKFRDLAWVGAPCSRSEMMPYETPSMALLRGDVETGGHDKDNRFGRWVEEQIVSWCGFDGGISYTMIHSNQDRKNHAKAFRSILQDVLVQQHGKPKEANELLHLYGLDEGKDEEGDDEALKKICLFESDLGFFAPCLAEAQGAERRSSSSSKQAGPRTVLQLFDLGNPFEGPLTPGKYATHTWDIVALLGAYEHRLSPEVKEVVKGWRERMIDYVCSGGEAAGLPAFTGSEREGDDEGKMVAVDSTGWRVQHTKQAYGKGTRRGEVLRIAKEVDEIWGEDIFWNDVCRRFLMKGE
jgi:hypothetical protein